MNTPINDEPSIQITLYNPVTGENIEDGSFKLKLSVAQHLQTIREMIFMNFSSENEEIFKIENLSADDLESMKDMEIRASSHEFAPKLVVEYYTKYFTPTDKVSLQINGQHAPNFTLYEHMNHFSPEKKAFFESWYINKDPKEIYRNFACLITTAGYFNDTASTLEAASILQHMVFKGRTIEEIAEIAGVECTGTKEENEALNEEADLMTKTMEECQEKYRYKQYMVNRD